MPHKGVIFVAYGITLLDECKKATVKISVLILCF